MLRLEPLAVCWDRVHLLGLDWRSPPCLPLQVAIKGVSVNLWRETIIDRKFIQTLAEKQVTEETQAPTKVFISYSWDSEDHKERVLALANTLRVLWGIETDIDQYVRAKPPFTPSQGWDLWMEKRIEWAEFVLIVCTETYKRRFRGDEEPGIGRGSTWEGTIIRQHLYNNQLESTKFIPVVFSSQDLTHVPIIFSGHDIYILEDEKSLRGLCYRLRKEPIVAMPEVATAKLQAPPVPKFFSPQKPKAEPPAVLLDITEIQDQKKTQDFQEDLGSGVRLDMVAIAGKRFFMGPSDNEVERSDDKEPQHRVEIQSFPIQNFWIGKDPVTQVERSDDKEPQHRVEIQSFWMGKYPVTQEQWWVVATKFYKINRDLVPEPSRFKGDRRPVEYVSWWEAVEFCDRLSRKTNHTYRLPSEAEWEYACRAGTTTPFHFGEIITTDLANYDGKETTTVGSFGVANAFGLYDMHGNVWEWCADHWHSDYKGAPTDGSAWLTADQNAGRLLRGGSWLNTPRYCRSANRHRHAPDFQGYGFGFRVVCVSSWTA